MPRARYASPATRAWLDEHHSRQHPLTLKPKPQTLPLNTPGRAQLHCGARGLRCKQPWVCLAAEVAAKGVSAPCRKGAARSGSTMPSLQAPGYAAGTFSRTAADAFGRTSVESLLSICMWHHQWWARRTW